MYSEEKIPVYYTNSIDSHNSINEQLGHILPNYSESKVGPCIPFSLNLFPNPTIDFLATNPNINFPIEPEIYLSNNNPTPNDTSSKVPMYPSTEVADNCLMPLLGSTVWSPNCWTQFAALTHNTAGQRRLESNPLNPALDFQSKLPQPIPNHTIPLTNSIPTIHQEYNTGDGTQSLEQDAYIPEHYDYPNVVDTNSVENNVNEQSVYHLTTPFTNHLTSNLCVTHPISSPHSFQPTNRHSNIIQCNPTSIHISRRNIPSLYGNDDSVTKQTSIPHPELDSLIKSGIPNHSHQFDGNLDNVSFEESRRTQKNMVPGETCDSITLGVIDQPTARAMLVCL